jgi:xyloglucan-specific exo-beta-1,4-glucanase
MRRALHFIAAACVAAALATAAQAEDYVWRSVRVGGGGFIPDIVFSPVEPGLAYARSDMGGAYRWDDAAQSWTPLQDGMAQSSYFGVESIAPDPADANVVTMAVGMYRRDQAAILRSHDRGANWEVYPVPFHMGGNEDGRGLGERLAVDPNDPRILYFGSRHDGLQRSEDAGAHWVRVDSLPSHGLGLPAQGAPTNAGISFVVFDPSSGAQGHGSRTLFAGLADPGEHHLFRSDDGGATWRAVEGEPRAALLPVQAELDANGALYVAYCVGVGPNGVSDGAVYKYATRAGAWTDITPPKEGAGGFMGLSIDRRQPGVVVVATMNRWEPGDTIWRSTDGGRNWRDLRAQSRRDVAATPFLLWGEPEANFGWWIAGLAIDPFDSDHLAYTTGATVYATHDSAAGPMRWRPWTQGIEQTAVITLASPPDGPFHLLSGFGDISGFAHDDFSVSPHLQFSTPVFANTNSIDIAGARPNVVVRSGTRPHRSEEGAPTLAYSTDYGASWAPLTAPPLRWTDADGAVSERRFDLSGDAAITVSADGASFVFMSPVPLITSDRGKTWAPARGLPAGAHPVADRVDASRFYALDFEPARMFVSDDGGATFTERRTRGLPADIRADRPGWREIAWPLMATPDHRGDLWFVSAEGLYHSHDGGAAFAKVDAGVRVERLAFGAAPPGRDYPALFAIGWRGDLRAIWRSDDVGRSWLRVNDGAHEYGRRFRTIAADPRVFGRVYVGTDGRGIVYGEPRS